MHQSLVCIHSTSRLTKIKAIYCKSFHFKLWPTQQWTPESAASIFCDMTESASCFLLLHGYPKKKRHSSWIVWPTSWHNLNMFFSVWPRGNVDMAYVLALESGNPESNSPVIGALHFRFSTCFRFELTHSFVCFLEVGTSTIISFNLLGWSPVPDQVCSDEYDTLTLLSWMIIGKSIVYYILDRHISLVHISSHIYLHIFIVRCGILRLLAWLSH